MTTTQLPVQTAFLKGLAENVISTFLQAFLAVVLVARTGAVPWLDALFIALFAALVTALSTVLITYGVLPPLRNRIVDLAYRAVITFAQTLLGYLVAAGAVSVLDFDWSAALQASVAAAGTALLKGLVGAANDKTFGASVFVPVSGMIDPDYHATVIGGVGDSSYRQQDETEQPGDDPTAALSDEQNNGVVSTDADGEPDPGDISTDDIGQHRAAP